MEPVVERLMAQSVLDACLDDRELAIVSSGGLRGDPMLAVRVDRHLDGCATCRRAVSALLKLERPAARSDPSRRSGVALGRYVLVRLLGRGGMGSVWLARDPELGRDVALKLVREADPERARRRVRAEARAQARVTDPRVVPVYDVGCTEAELYIAMAFVDGGDLRAWLTAERRTWREILDIVLDAARGLMAAHAAGLVHRDIKPGNILVDRQGAGRLGDFGFATALAIDSTPTDRSRTVDDSEAPTASSIRGGTPGYTAPEVRSGESADARADQYSLCVTLHEAWFGHRPGATPSCAAAIDAQTIPTRLVRALLRGLSPEPAARHRSIEALIHALRPRPRSFVKSTVAAALLVGMGGWLVTSSATVRPRACDTEPERGLGGDDYDRAREALLARGWSTASAAQVSSAIAARVESARTRWDEVCEIVDHDASPRDRDAELACLSAKLVSASAMLAAIGDHGAVIERVDELLDPRSISCRPSAHASATSAELARAWSAFERAEALRTLGSDHDAYAAALEAEEAARTIGDDVLLASTLLLRARLQSVLGDPRDALAAVEQARGIADAHDAADLAAASRVAWIWIAAGRLGRTREAFAAIPEATAAAHRSGDVRQLESLHRSAALVLMLQGDFAGAEGRLSDQLALLDRRSASALERAEVEALLAQVLVRVDPSRALELSTRAIATLTSSLGPDHPRLGSALADRGQLLALLGRPEDALADYERAMTLQRDYTPGATIRLAMQKSTALAMLGRYDESVTVAREVVALSEHESERAADETGQRRGSAWAELGVALVNAGRPAEAIDALARARTLLEAAVGTDSLEMAQVDFAAGASHRRLGDLPRARNELERALARTTALLGAEHPVRVAVARELTAVEGELHTATVDARVDARP